MMMEFETIREKDISTGVVEILKKELQPDRIILFGSRVKNKADRFADFDFAVDSPKPPFQKLKEIRDQVEKISGLYKIDLVFLPEVEEDFLNIINNTGSVLYEKGS